MEEAASQLERDHVHNVYDKIAPYFNDSRYKAWPKVRQFLLDLQPGSIVADIGGCPLQQRRYPYTLSLMHCLSRFKSNQSTSVLVLRLTVVSPDRLRQRQVPSHQRGGVQAGVRRVSPLVGLCMEPRTRGPDVRRAAFALQRRLL